MYYIVMHWRHIMAKTATIIFRADPENKLRIEKLAELTKRPASFFYNYLLEEYLEDVEDIFMAEHEIQLIREGKEAVYPVEDVIKELGL